MYVYIRRPLPELERARLQLQPSNTVLQTAAPPCCRLHPTVLQNVGSSLLCTISGVPQGIRARGPPLLQSPSNLPKSVLPPAQEYQIANFGFPGYPTALHKAPICYKRLAVSTPGQPRPPKVVPSQLFERSAAEAVAYK